MLQRDGDAGQQAAQRVRCRRHRVGAVALADRDLRVGRRSQRDQAAHGRVELGARDVRPVQRTRRIRRDLQAVQVRADLHRGRRHARAGRVDVRDERGQTAAAGCDVLAGQRAFAQAARERRGDRAGVGVQHRRRTGFDVREGLLRRVADLDLAVGPRERGAVARERQRCQRAATGHLERGRAAFPGGCQRDRTGRAVDGCR